MNIDSLLFRDDTVIDEIYEDTMKEYFNSRVLIINSIITDDILKDIIIYILLWNKDDRDIPQEKRQPIKLYIDSDGGSVFSAQNLIEVIKNSKTPVYGIAFSFAASAACSILISCDKRYAFPHTTTLIHDGQIDLGMSTTNKHRDTVRFMDKVDTMVREFIIANTKITEEEFEENKDREQYFFADEAKEKGIIDYIIGVDCELEDIL